MRARMSPRIGAAALWVGAIVMRMPRRREVPTPNPQPNPILTQRPLPQDTLAEVSKHKDKGLLNQVQARQKAYLSAIVDRCREGR